MNNNINFLSIPDFFLDLVKKNKISQAELALQKNSGFSVSVRETEIEKLEHSQTKSLSFTLYHDQRSASAQISDLSESAICKAFEKAKSALTFVNQDPFSGLADPTLLAFEYPDLKLYHHWEITPQEAIQFALEGSRLAKSYDNKIQSVESFGIDSYDTECVYANSNQFLGRYRASDHAMSCVVVAKAGDQMQRDHEYCAARDPKDLWTLELLAKKTVDKTVQRLGPRRIPTQKCPVIFSSEVARGLMGHFIGAISGGNIYRGISFLANRIGQSVFAPHIDIWQEPHILSAMGSAPFDAEGVATQKQFYIQGGKLLSYAMGSYSARKLGLQSTGNSGGIYNLCVSSGDKNLSALIKTMQRGLLITEFLGQGVNLLTGDYSRGAFGYWVEHGEIQFPIDEITLAGNLKNMFLGIVDIANDIDTRGSVRTGSILIDEMVIGGE